jgi:hypothetical protein
MKSLFKNSKKGEALGLSLLIGGGIMIVIIAVVLGLGGKVLSNIDPGGGNATQNNGSIYGQTAVNDMSKYLPTIGAVLIIATIIGLLLAYLYNKLVKSI